MKNWIEISASRLAANYRTLTEQAGAAISVLAVIKADAYGHNAALCAPVLARAGAPWLGVTDLQQGIEVQTWLLEEGIALADQPRLLVMCGSLPDEAALLALHGLTPVVWGLEELAALRQAAAAHGRQLAVHLEIDTGMSRQGVAPGPELDRVLAWFAAQQDLLLDGVMTHFACAEVAGSTHNAAQQRLFEQAITQVRASGLRPQWVHAGSTSSADNLHATASPLTSLDWLAAQAALVGARAMVRPGLALYGHCLPIECSPGYGGPHDASVCPRLQSVLTWKARVIGMREIAAGTPVGYGATFTAERPMRLALLPVGYADGLRRELSSSAQRAGWAVLQGQPASIVGRVSMNLTVVDITELPNVALGDEAIILGEGITAEDHARIAGTISYEILCAMKAPHQLVP